MRDFRRLPSLLRVASLLGLLLAPASFALAITTLISFSASRAASTPPTMDSSRMFAIAANLGMLSGACLFGVNRYTARLRRMGSEPLPLTSWQDQARVILLLATLPLCAIALVILFPSTFLALSLAFACTILAALALVVVNLWALSRQAQNG